MRVFIGNNAVTLDKRTFKGAGGEGAVHKILHNGHATGLKVYETPTRERAEKLMAFFKRAPRFTNRVIAPQELVFNSAGTAVGYTYDPSHYPIGFTMPFVDGNFAELKQLSNKKFRKSYRISTRDVALVFLDGIPTLSKVVHSQGFVVGDLSDANEITINNQMFFWDVDAWQFDGFPCPVATRDFVDPALYGVDFSKKPSFNTGNDWYSYAVLLFKSLLLVHPYGGTHNRVDDQLERAARKISVFDKNVVYPVIGIHPDILTDDLHHVFYQYFTEGQRMPFPEKTLSDYLDSLRECTSCGTYFPGGRGTCPVCSAKTMVVIQKPSTSAKDLDIYEVIRVNGDVLANAVIGDQARLLVNENGKIVYYAKDLRSKTFPGVRRELFRHIPGSKFEIGSEHVYVNQPKSEEILVYEIATGKLVGKLTTEIFAPVRRASFRASASHLYRIDGNELKFGRLRGNSFEEQKLRNVVDDQTWFWVEDNSDTPYVFGLFQVLKQQMFWMVKDGRHYDVQIPELEMGEAVLDLAVRFSSQGVYLLRKTQLNGINYVRREMVDSSGKVIFTDRMEESKLPNPDIHNITYSTGLALHATDKGVLNENVKTGATKLFTSTEGFVDSGDSLLRYGASILAIKQDRVLMISPK